MRTSLLALVALAVSVSASAASQDVASLSAASVELPVDARELLSTASQVSLASHEDTLVVRLRAMQADSTTAKTDAQLREQAQILFKLYKVLNPKAVAAMGSTESEQFETFYKTVFQQILARVDADKSSSSTTSAPNSSTGTTPGTTAAPGSSTTPGSTAAPGSSATPGSGTPSTGASSAPSLGSSSAPSSGSGSVVTTRYSAVQTTDPTPVAESLSFFSQVYDPTLAQNVRALQDNSNNLEAIVQSTKETSSTSDPASQFQAPTVLDGVDEGPTTLDGRRLANATGNETYGNVQLLFCDVGGNAIWKWKHTPYTDDPIGTTTTVDIFLPKKVCEAPQRLEVKVTAYQSGCSKQNHPEGCDKVYWKGCGGLTVNPNSDRIVVARTGGRTLGMLYYKNSGDSCQGRVVDAIKTYKGKKFNSISYAEYAPSGHLYFTDSPFGLATGPADFEGDILDKSPLRELPFNGVFLLKNTSKKVDLIECAMDRPNKIAFSPKGDVMYITNSRKGNSYVKQFNLTANGEVRKSSVFFNFTAHPELETDKGYADGIKTDSDGNVYVAAYKGIYIFSPKGELIGNLRSNQELSGIALGGGRLFLTGAFGVVAQSTGIKPASALPFAKTDCPA